MRTCRVYAKVELAISVSDDNRTYRLSIYIHMIVGYVMAHVADRKIRKMTDQLEAKTNWTTCISKVFGFSFQQLIMIIPSQFHLFPRHHTGNRAILS